MEKPDDFHNIIAGTEFAFTIPDTSNGGFMEFRAYFKHMDSSLPLFAYAEKKVSEKVDRFVNNAVEGHITFCVENGLNKVQFQLIAGGGLKIVMSAEDDMSMYSSVDILVDKLEKKLRRHKEKIQNHKLRPADLELLNFDDMPEKAQKSESYAAEDTVDAKYVIEFEKARKEKWMRPQASMA